MDLKAYREDQLKVIAEIEFDLEFASTRNFRMFQRGPDGVDVDITGAHVERCKKLVKHLKHAVEITDVQLANSSK
ncbi:hypothetical protein HX900_17560 [Rhizobium sp. WYCCWR 11290]|uniref:Uncharacterized protein n=1 Tax=Rhizobium changzhiense TaxID=2692317 RepID=A0A7Z0RK11_9HYPH|nr:hypothetical protein [Rhizobium changzhiense]NZD62914.1 hypothetical protein [Rhizobium changzhiense]